MEQSIRVVRPDGPIGIIPRADTHRVVGTAKDGLRLWAEEEGSRIALYGRAEPLLLYVVFGTALAVAAAGSLFVSPGFGLAGVLLFSVLFAPLLVFSALGAVRLRTVCSLDRVNQRVHVAEQGYVSGWEREWRLEALTAVVVVARPANRLSSVARTYELLLDLGPERYLARSGPSRDRLLRDASRLARFIGVPVLMEDERVSPAARTGESTMVAVVLFVAPIIVALGVMASLVRPPGSVADTMAASMAALILCQVSAIAAFAYMRRPGAS